MLEGKICLVTGASRGVGRGVALALGAAGATVYVTGRSVREGDAPLPGTVYRTAEDIDQAGGQGIAVSPSVRPSTPRGPSTVMPMPTRSTCFAPSSTRPLPT